MTVPAVDSLIALAVRLADAAGPIVMSHFRQPLEVEDKADASPVTVADRETEAAMREIIEEAFPGHGILGEEYGAARRDAEYLWVLDPIDGTSAYIAGLPTFGTLIALLRAGTPVVGVMDCPALNQRWIGAEGRPTTFNGAPVRARPCPSLDRARLCATSPYMFEDRDVPAFERLRKACKGVEFGGHCLPYGLLANGTVDVVCEGTMEPYDYAALVPIVAGAGGVVSDWRGGALGLEGDGTVLAAGDARTHKAALEVLAGRGDT